MSITSLQAPAGLAQFWRSYQVTIDNGTGQALQYGNVLAGSANIRASFSIERQFAGTGARQLVLTNLAPATIRTIKASFLGDADDGTLVPGTGSRATVQVGYAGVLSTLFIGAVSRCVTERTGADVHTKMDLLDAESFTLNCVFCKSYAPGKPGVSVQQILRDIVQAMTISFADTETTVAAGVAVGIPSQNYPQGIVFNGTCGAALRMLLTPLKLDFRVHNGALEITPVNGYTGAKAVLLTPSTGLLNVPSATMTLGRAGVSFKALLNTRIQPGTLVTFNAPGQHASGSDYLRASNALAGYFRVMQSSFKGDTHGPEWTVDCSALPYDGSLSMDPTPF